MNVLDEIDRRMGLRPGAPAGAYRNAVTGRIMLSNVGIDSQNVRAFTSRAHRAMPTQGIRRDARGKLAISNLDAPPDVLVGTKRKEAADAVAPSSGQVAKLIELLNSATPEQLDALPEEMVNALVVELGREGAGGEMMQRMCRTFPRPRVGGAR